MEELFMNFGSLFSTFGWWSVFLVVGVTGIMFPINLLYKKIMSTESTQRARKLLGFFSVYAISAVIVLAFSKLANSEIDLSFDYVAGSTLALGFCSQFLWEIVKLVRDYGLAPVINAITQSKAWKNVLGELQKTYGIDSSITDYIADFIEDKYIDKEKTDAITELLNNKSQILSEIQNKVSGFVEDKDIGSVAEKLFTALTDSWSK